MGECSDLQAAWSDPCRWPDDPAWLAFASRLASDEDPGDVPFIGACDDHEVNHG